MRHTFNKLWHYWELVLTSEMMPVVAVSGGIVQALFLTGLVWPGSSRRMDISHDLLQRGRLAVIHSSWKDPFKALRSSSAVCTLLALIGANDLWFPCLASEIDPCWGQWAHKLGEKGCPGLRWVQKENASVPFQGEILMACNDCKCNSKTSLSHFKVYGSVLLSALPNTIYPENPNPNLTEEYKDMPGP